ncbi:hypothetical protein OG819_55585 [Streptomyces sp. NBC_01549]|uniref:hypothetical protein n=1 Tax=Streptomyces sp. NBC_01549 TaxID=2975874 RepID=UPI00225500A0|nr:hypothetical protein [Streptomyces sp. NBC_01549]MCX4598380.1 hypothetical protein [Streptomyces sp. NBC_01549]
MTSHIDQLLAKARLVNEPYTHEDIDAAADRIAARVAARRADPGTDAGPAPCNPPQPPGHVGADAAAQDLRTLCETAVMSTGAVASLRHFVARSLPEPAGARVLGCILQLTEREDSARFWWQYAAGAGDSPAVYCLYLHHMAHGEQGEAEWWHTQTEVSCARSAEEAGPQELATTLRVLQGLKTGEELSDLATRTAVVSAVLDYVPAAVAYVDDDLDLPLPDPDFADHITSLTTTLAPRAPRRRTFDPLAERHSRWSAPPSAAPARPADLMSCFPTSPTSPPAWKWNDSGGAFGHTQRVGDFAAARRRDRAWQAFWQHCEDCADCDPSGIPCRTYGTLW